MRHTQLMKKMGKITIPDGVRNAAIGSALGALLMGANRALSKDEDDDSTIAGEALRGAIGGGVAGYAIPEGVSRFAKFLNDGNSGVFDWTNAALGGGATAVATGTVGAGAHVLRAIKNQVADPTTRLFDWSALGDRIRYQQVDPVRAPRSGRDSVAGRFARALWNHINGSKWGFMRNNPELGVGVGGYLNGRRRVRGGVGLGISLLAAVLSGLRGDGD